MSAGRRRLAREVTVAERQHGNGSAQVDHVLPEPPGRAAVRVEALEADGQALGQRGQLLDPQPEQVAPGRRVAAEPDPVAGVDDPGEERDQQPCRRPRRTGAGCPPRRR